MKVLVISNTPWSTENSFGNSFSNIFDGISDVEFANIYCRYGLPKNRFQMECFQITEKSIIENLRNPQIQVGNRVVKEEVDVLKFTEQKIFDLARKSRYQIFFVMRNLIWKIGRWKNTKLSNFIEEFDPDFLFQPIYHSTYINDIVLYSQKLKAVPMIGYVSDDVYTLRQFSWSPLYWINRLIVRTKVKKVITGLELLYVISEIQKKEYEKIFGIECKILTKGARFDVEPASKEVINTPIKMIFTGNLGDGRWKAIKLISEAIKVVNTSGVQIEMYIYSATPQSRRMKKAMYNDYVYDMGRVDACQISTIQDEADVLVHVESLDFKDSLTVHQSFSTKLVDYFCKKRCIFAVGRSDVASINHLIKNDAAIVAVTKKQILINLKRIVADKNILDIYSKKAWECGLKNHHIDNIQSMLKDDFRKIMRN